ncbi:MAG: prolipoprotein diacylglyceryl transferase [Planctomycetota bacterium]|nr:prolipoprotein diacylglyceryl transferase [Planctomycetota bacterium]
MEWAFIDWEVNTIAFKYGPVEIRWYGICFLAAILTAIKLMEPLFKRAKRDPDDATSLTIHVVFGVIIGSRLVHCLFYDPETYLSNPLRILKIWEGGLASHGAYLGAIIGAIIWVKGWVYYASKWCGTKLPEPVSKFFVFLFGPPIYTPGLNIRQMLDITALGVTATIVYVRLGNLFNHEIIGRVTEAPWGFRFYLAPENFETALNKGWLYNSPATPIGEVLVLLVISFGAALAIHTFQNKSEEENFGFPTHYALGIFFILKVLYEAGRVYPEAHAELGLTPRHPSQIYEMLMGFFMFGMMYWLTYKRADKHKDGFRISVFMVLYFIFRFSLEFFKEYQSDYAENNAAWLTMGQLLSLPFIVLFLPCALMTLGTPEPTTEGPSDAATSEQKSEDGSKEEPEKTETSKDEPEKAKDDSEKKAN